MKELFYPLDNLAAHELINRMNVTLLMVSSANTAITNNKDNVQSQTTKNGH
jgi:hypothetical protein